MTRERVAGTLPAQTGGHVLGGYTAADVYARTGVDDAFAAAVRASQLISV